MVDPRSRWHARRSLVHALVLVSLAFGSVFAAQTPAGAITGGTEDLDNQYANVGIIFFYEPDGRFRCSGTLISPQVVLTAAHCTFEDIGQVIVSFDPLISRTPEEAEIDVPRAADDEGPDDAISEIGYTEADITAPRYEGEQTWYLGTAYTHPEYSDFTDIKNWFDVGVVILEEPVDLPLGELAPEDYLNDFRQPLLNKVEFLVIGYGTEVRGNPPTPERQPIVRRYTTEIGQKLTPQIVQTNSNENDPRAGGGTCGGDSGGPLILDGYIVGVTSYGYTANCRYIGGYQRVDIGPVLDWLAMCIADLECPTKEERAA